MVRATVPFVLHFERRHVELICHTWTLCEACPRILTASGAACLAGPRQPSQLFGCIGAIGNSTASTCGREANSCRGVRDRFLQVNDMPRAIYLTAVRFKAQHGETLSLLVCRLRLVSRSTPHGRCVVQVVVLFLVQFAHCLNDWWNGRLVQRQVRTTVA